MNHLIGLPFFQSSPASAPFVLSNLAAQLTAIAAFVLLSSWSKDCGAVRLFPDRSRPPDPVANSEIFRN